MTTKTKPHIQPICREHEWESERGYESKYDLSGLGEIVEKKVICRFCGKKGTEIWVYSTTIVED